MRYKLLAGKNSCKHAKSEVCAYGWHNNISNVSMLTSYLRVDLSRNLAVFPIHIHMLDEVWILQK